MFKRIGHKSGISFVFLRLNVRKIKGFEGQVNNNKKQYVPLKGLIQQKQLY
jgi:hypothetical protein